MGVFKGGWFVLLGVVGWLIYGLYLILDKGWYCVDIDGEGMIVDGGICFVEVIVDFGKYVVV